MFRLFSRTVMINPSPALPRLSNASRALEIGASAVSVGAQICFFVYLNQKPEPRAELQYNNDQTNRPTGQRY